VALSRGAMRWWHGQVAQLNSSGTAALLYGSERNMGAAAAAACHPPHPARQILIESGVVVASVDSAWVWAAALIVCVRAGGRAGGSAGAHPGHRQYGLSTGETHGRAPPLN
jgi:hypothetical protein